jgi:putative transposase
VIQTQDHTLPIAPLLQALGLSRATYYRKRVTATPTPELPVAPQSDAAEKSVPPSEQDLCTAASDPVEVVKQPEQPIVDPLAPSRCRVAGRALSPEERREVYKRLYEDRFIDRTPTEIWATLLDEGTYLCSVSTFYRLLKADRVHPKRAQKSSNYARPELLATGPNQLWSWDITKLKGPAPWTYFHLYVIIDVYSRCVVGWMIAYRESKELAKQFIDETLAKHSIVAGTLTIHADRGSAMTSKSVALLLSDLGVVKTHSRPHVSNDNPYSESQFKTLKGRPEFPDRFSTIEQARALVEQLMNWYNKEHHHGGIALLTPLMVHSGQADVVIAKRQSHLDRVYQAHPQRFVNQPPRHASLPEAVWINRPLPTAEPSRDGSGDKNASTA